MNIRRLEKGERNTIVVFSILSTILFILSLQMFMKDSDLSSQGSFPLFLSSLMVLMSVMMLTDLRKYGTAFDKGIKLSEKVKVTYKFLFPGKLLQLLILLAIYAVILPKIGFGIATFLYLFSSMILQNRKDIKNALIASISIVIFIYIVFQFIFKVILP